ncbi:type II toxin-antitoxin system CcdA family antitoxin [endosymbiont GvMRE of Glomus versiforme]|uniref:type II toxin-antitoxin system CcdA family antitoxin n=1 Tax=endosymbiont GvMRE of Glomus versiforme TaxID=2039283 RepID=UPI000EB81C7D|nr:type II toxin-antitoxin system CcdA family antitoxin [endosymbiont GvMRE of Glomus versiforme]RHZ36352.1 hypothetical protein GvMRE_Ic1g127 [endosymbiont GvMRE of Glomus versiforme]
MAGRNANIYFPEKTYQKLRQVAGTKISRFVNEAVEEKIKQVKQQKKEQLRQELIKDYQAVAKSQKRRQEDLIWDETSNDGL